MAMPWLTLQCRRCAPSRLSGDRSGPSPRGHKAKRDLAVLLSTILNPDGTLPLCDVPMGEIDADTRQSISSD